MSLRINDVAPDFTADSTEGTISFHEFIGERWVIIFSHPKDFTPVCTTELGFMAGLAGEFDKRDCAIVGVSVDSVEDHVRWKDDIRAATGHAVSYPLIGDPELKIAKLYNMLPSEAGDNAAGRSAVDNATVRSVFIIGPDKRIKLMMTYPMSTGRNFHELLRALDALQVTAAKNVATPANWSPGDEIIIPATVSDDAARDKFPDGWRAATPYLRFAKEPE